LGLAEGRKQFDLQRAAAKLTAEVPYETARELFAELTGMKLGTERLHTLTNTVAKGVGVLDVAPTRSEIAEQIATVAAGRHQRPILVLALDGAHVPTRPDTAQGSRPGRKTQRAKRARWQGQWREAKGFRGYLVDDARIVHLLSWHQIQSDEELFAALQQVKDAGLIPEEAVRLCVAQHVECIQTIESELRESSGTEPAVISNAADSLLAANGLVRHQFCDQLMGL